MLNSQSDKVLSAAAIFLQIRLKRAAVEDFLENTLLSDIQLHSKSYVTMVVTLTGFFVITARIRKTQSATRLMRL